MLFFGLDDAAMNTDVICFASFDPANNTIAFVQLPRDTYYNFGGTQNKINQLYAHYLINYNSDEALKYTADDISKAFGIKTTGYVSVTTAGLVRAIDSLGGIDIEVSQDGVFTDEFGKNPLRLRAGENHLEGASAVQFIRYRQGYLTGDLGRLDAQKLFFRAVLRKFASRPSLEKILDAYISARDEIQTNLDVFDILRMNGAGIRQLSQAKVSYLTMPGEAIVAQNGISYYSISKKAAENVCRDYLFSQGGTFDPQGRMLKKDELAFCNIYNDKNNAYRVYDNDSVADITVPKKQ